MLRMLCSVTEPSLLFATVIEVCSEDMPAHIKSSMPGCSLTVPIRRGRLGLGIWQGICLCGHRNRGGARRIIATMQGEVAAG